ncbi:hypothetical protein [Enterococcus cecorum]|uniref:hypothetical protein n=1 Tax=Enterococcus cecorum TaxID=44008 RepID=UPI000DFE62DD|nr:hypothetical protein [Enterococcus cecorum]RBR36015.1 hypothetical protein EB26_00837 [Enterococcus cecorum]
MEILVDILTRSYEIALPVLLGYIVWLLKEQRRKADLEDKKREDNSKGTMLLLRVKLIEYHDEYMRKGRISSYAYQNFCEMYEVYHALGGNGMITKMMHEIDELHLNHGGNKDED